VLKKTRLLPSDLTGLETGTAPNPIHPAFTPMQMYYWKDIVYLLMERKEPIPDSL
jgi:hypothetical protein